MANPTSVRRTHNLGFNAAPQSTGAQVVASFRSDPCEQTDAEDATSAIPNLIGDRQCLARAALKESWGFVARQPALPASAGRPAIDPA